MDKDDLQEIQNKIDYDFIKPDLLLQAFVRRSYAEENGGEDNEVLEFIGDKALDIVIVKILVEKFGYYTSECDDYDEDEDFDEFCCEYSEGKLTDLKKRFVGKKTLASRIDWLGLAEYLIMGRGDERNHVEREASVKEDLFEAIIGAVALDSDWDFEKIQNTVEVMLDPESYLFDDKDENYVALIQNWALKEYGELPRMRTSPAPRYSEPVSLYLDGTKSIEVFKAKHYKVSLSGNVRFEAWSDDNEFICELILDGIKPKFVGYGESKKEARQIVCEGAYHYLEKHNLLFSIRDEIENPNKADAINQLETLARRDHFSIPTYNFEQSYDKDGNPVWKCECHIAEYDTFFRAESSSKKDAKKTTAFKMLKYVLGEE